MTGPTPHVADPYRALGVSRSATDAEIKAAHRKLAKRYHPDTEDGDTRRFLRVQEAYRVLSDPLLRREWDARHAPGPVRADRGERPQRQPRTRAATSNAEPSEIPRPAADRRRQPRSSRAYTWSAAEVPWWEEGAQREAKRRGRRAAERPSQDDDQQPPPGGAPDGAPDAVPDAPNEFDVYNRSSGAAWSMAARAYFRRGDQDLPRRGSFHHQGSQPLTAARARTAAEQEARRRRSEAPLRAAAPATAATSAGRAPAADVAQHSRATIVRRSLRAAWPSVGQRLLFALIAWLPLAAGIALTSSARVDEVVQAAMMALSLGVLAAAPRLAYVLAVATLGLLLTGGALAGILYLVGVRLPLGTGLTAVVGAALALGYVAVAGIVALGPGALRPWTRQAQPVRGR
jgi:hypothetical protein